MNNIRIVLLQFEISSVVFYKYLSPLASISIFVITSKNSSFNPFVGLYNTIIKLDTNQLRETSRPSLRLQTVKKTLNKKFLIKELRYKKGFMSIVVPNFKCQSIFLKLNENACHFSTYIECLKVMYRSRDIWKRAIQKPTL